MDANSNDQNQQEVVEAFPLDEAMIGLLAEINPQIQALVLQKNGALTLFIRQHKLQGEWREAPNGKELLKADRPATAPAFAPASKEG